MISQCRSISYTKLKTQEIMGIILVGGGGGGGGRGGGDQERSPTGGRRDREVAGVDNLDRSPDQSPGGEAYIP